MKKWLIAFAIFSMVPGQALASFAVALAPGGNPIVHMHDGYHVNYDDAPGALAECRKLFKSPQCKIVAQGASGCVALANNGRKGTAIRWAAGQARRKDLADQAALDACRTQFSGSCRVVHDFCQQ